MRLPVPRVDRLEPDAGVLVAIDVRLTELRIEREALFFELYAVAMDVASSSSDDAVTVCGAGFEVLTWVESLGAGREELAAFKNAHCLSDRFTRLVCSSLRCIGHQVWSNLQIKLLTLDHHLHPNHSVQSRSSSTLRCRLRGGLECTRSPLVPSGEWDYD